MALEDSRPSLWDNHIVADALKYASSTTRLPAILKISPYLQGDELVRLLLEEWSGCDDVRPYRAEALEIFRAAARANGGPIRSEDCSMPKGSLTIYRAACRAEAFFASGRRKPRSRLGISWTTDRDRAVWFVGDRVHRAYRRRLGTDLGRPVLLTAEIDAGDILGIFDDRLEREVVVDPAKLRRLSIETLPVPD